MLCRRIYICSYCSNCIGRGDFPITVLIAIIPLMRRWNMGIHIERKHKFQYNPIPDMKQGPPNGSKLFQPQYEPPDGSKLFRPQKPEVFKLSFRAK